MTLSHIVFAVLIFNLGFLAGAIWASRDRPDVKGNPRWMGEPSRLG